MTVTPLQLRCAAPCGTLFPWRTQKPSFGHSMTDNKQLPYSNNWQGTRELDLKTTTQFELAVMSSEATVLLLSSLEEEERRRRRRCHVSRCGHVKMLCREERRRSRSRMLQCLPSSIMNECFSSDLGGGRETLGSFQQEEKKKEW